MKAVETKEAMTGQELEFSGTILPSQYFDMLKSDGLSPEKRLMLAILTDAINILQGSRLGGRRSVFAEAGRWVNTIDAIHPFSFDNVCEALGVDSAVLRLRLADLISGRNTAARLGMRRIRIKDSSRSQHMTKNYTRRRRPRKYSP